MRAPRPLPLPVLLALPALAAAVVTAARPGLAPWAVGAGGVASYALGLLLSRQLTRAVRTGDGCLASPAREVRRVQRHVAAAARRAQVLEGMVERTRTSADSASHATARLLGELVGAEEATRGHLAAELHDTVAQTLSQALLQLRADAATRCNAGIESVELAEEQLRAAMARMRPPELAEGELARAVGDLCADLELRYGVAVGVRWTHEQVALPVAVATTVYRFAQEALLNATVHADGVGVRLSFDVLTTQTGSRCVEVQVRDGGPGFDPDGVASAGGRHVGLRLARQRAALAGGRLTVRSAVGCGTSVRLVLPLTAPGAAEPFGPTGGGPAGTSGHSERSAQVGLAGAVREAGS